MPVLKLGFPTLNGSGLDDQVSPHFGHCPHFTLVDVDTDAKSVGAVNVVEQPPHMTGGCMVPVMALKKAGADAVVVNGIGMRPLMGFQQVGVTPFLGLEGTVKENVDAFLAGKLEILSRGTCGHA